MNLQEWTKQVENHDVDLNVVGALTPNMESGPSCHHPFDPVHACDDNGEMYGMWALNPIGLDPTSVLFDTPNEFYDWMYKEDDPVEPEPEPSLHVHLWDLDNSPDEPVKDYDIPYTDEYDDHYQFAMTLDNGIDVEVRLWKSQFTRVPTATPGTKLTPVEQYALGMAAGSFSVGEIDQGIHCVLPVTDMATGERTNEVFSSLCHQFAEAPLSSASQSGGMWHIETLQSWCAENGIDIK